MKILLLADKEEPGLWDYFSKDKVEGVDLIVSCGDLRHEYLEFLVTLVNKPLLYVRGNHDTSYDKYPPEGCDCIDGDILKVRGYTFLGLGGSMRYREGDCMYSEKEMEKRIRKGRRRIRKEGPIDIFVTHAPARGYGDQEDLAHRGFECFNTFIETYHPKYMFYAHVHEEYGHFERIRVHESGTILVNASGSYILELP